jgi:pSer/pThr/pTyr-binding forkhead associated (FHA) protein
MVQSEVVPVRLIALDGWPDILVARSLVVIGRHPQCDITLNVPQISRRHCCLTELNGEVLVRDLGSRNGVWINGQRVRLGRLRPGDELSIAHLTYRLAPGLDDQKTLTDSIQRI